MFELLVGAIGVPLAKFLAKQWLGDSVTGAIAGGMVDYFKDRLGSEREARRAARRIDELAEEFIEGLGPYFEREQGKGLDLEPVLVQLQLTLEGRADAAMIVAQRLDAQKLYDHWLGARPEAVRTFSEGEASAYRTLLHATAAGLVAVADKLPRFEAAAVKSSLDALDQLARQGDTIIAAVGQAVAAVDALRTDVNHLRRGDDGRQRRITEHEADYRNTLRQEAAKLRLFGVDYDPTTPKEWPLEIAYVPLRLELEGHRDRLGYETLLALLPHLGGRLLVEGVAGSGKTTLVQWTALQALDFQRSSARRSPRPSDLLRAIGPELKFVLTGLVPPQRRSVFEELIASVPLRGRPSRDIEPNIPNYTKEMLEGGLSEAPDWRRRMPFLVKLRDCEGSLPGPEDLPYLLTKAIGKPPGDWVYATLKDGRGLVLLDGIDEVPDRQRADIWQSIRDYFETYPDSLFIVSSRPDAVEPEYLPLFGAARARIQPMDPTDRERFIEHWHEAVAVELSLRGQPHRDLPEAARALAARIRAVPALDQIAETPLLCAAVCFLNRARSGDIPDRLVELLRVLCELLISRLDRDRFGDSWENRFSRAYGALDTKEKTDALAAIAQYMVREGKPTVPDKDLLAPLREAIARLPKPIAVEPIEILRALKERSSVLRGRSETTSEFAHNVFRSFLAAQAYARGTSFSDLLDKARQTADPRPARPRGGPRRDRVQRSPDRGDPRSSGWGRADAGPMAANDGLALLAGRGRFACPPARLSRATPRQARASAARRRGGRLVGRARRAGGAATSETKEAERRRGRRLRACAAVDRQQVLTSCPGRLSRPSGGWRGGGVGAGGQPVASRRDPRSRRFIQAVTQCIFVASASPHAPLGPDSAAGRDRNPQPRGQWTPQCRADCPLRRPEVSCSGPHVDERPRAAAGPHRSEEALPRRHAGSAGRSDPRGTDEADNR